MGVVERLLKRLDDNINGAVARHLELALPEQRSISPDAPWSPFQVAGYWSHCACCEHGCPDVHRDRCDMHHPLDAS